MFYIFRDIMVYKEREVKWAREYENFKLIFYHISKFLMLIN